MKRRELMEYAHYSALSEADWLAVNQERLMLDMPIKINWEHCDPRLFSRFYNRNPERTEGLYKCGFFSRCLCLCHAPEETMQPGCRSPLTICCVDSESSLSDVHT